ncbi:MAG: hydrogenase [Mariprofundaceae bacterium]|nr:hydrogenase [Mariprofundaceae bacterium]
MLKHLHIELGFVAIRQLLRGVVGVQQLMSYQMRVKRNRCLTPLECSDKIIQLDLEAMPGERLKVFRSGQFVRMGLPGKKDVSASYFAIASEPEDADIYSFVIKESAGISAHLVGLQPGAAVDIDGPMGKGFDVRASQPKNLLLLGVGTGVAPLRSVWRSVAKNRDAYGHVAIYAGFLTPMHIILTDELETLAQDDIQVHVSVTEGSEYWSGPIGFVQDSLRKDRPVADNTVVCITGMNAMVDACTETLIKLGFHDEQILLNF